MKKTTIILLLNLYLIFFGNNLFSQNIGVNSSGTLPNNSAMLDVDATDKGILIPRMTTAQRNAIVAPATSLMIFNTTTNCLEIFGGGIWQSIYCMCTGAPAVPGIVTGNTSICSGTSNTYFISPVGGATSYTWTAPVGWTINSGQGTISIGTTSGATSGDVCVSSVNACGTSSQSCLTVTVNTAPATPGAITGLTSVTNGQVGVVYSIAPVPGATTYTWSVPSGSTITAGQGTTSITVTFGATSGDVCVTASNTCGTSASSCLAVTVTGCYVPGSLVFSYTGGQQTWTVPCGVTSITVDVKGAAGGTVVGGSGTSIGGQGGRIQGTIAVTPGNTIYVNVGEMGGNSGTSSAGGFNGGGNGGSVTYCAGGGGASDLRLNGTLLSDRIFVGAGGGGSGTNCWGNGDNGGNGGGLIGAPGCQCSSCVGGTPSYPGAGGTQAAGGLLGNDQGQGCTQSGTLGIGGNGACTYGGGGGGGYYGGGGAGYGGGGGGSNYFSPLATGVVNTQGTQLGNGQVTITW